MQAASFGKLPSSHKNLIFTFIAHLIRFISQPRIQIVHTLTRSHPLYLPLHLYTMTTPLAPHHSHPLSRLEHALPNTAIQTQPGNKRLPLATPHPDKPYMHYLCPRVLWPHPANIHHPATMITARPLCALPSASKNTQASLHPVAHPVLRSPTLLHHPKHRPATCTLSAPSILWPHGSLYLP